MMSGVWSHGNLRKVLGGAILIFAAVYCGFVFSSESYVKFLLLMLLLAAAAIAWSLQARYHFLGLAALILAGVLLPIEFGSAAISLNAALFAAGFLCLSWWLTLIILDRKSTIYPSRAVFAIGALMVVVLISFTAGQFPWFPTSSAPLKAQLAGCGLFVLSGGIFLVVGHEIQRLSQLRQLTWLFLASGGVFCVSQSVPGLDSWFRWSTPESVGSIFWIWLVALGCSQAFFNQSLSRLARLLLLGLTALAIFRGIFLASSWVSGWLPPLVAMGIVLSFRFKRTVIGMCALAVPATLILAGKATSLLMMQEHYSYLTRIEAWRVILQLVWKSPVLGMGPANYYYYTLMYPILGWYVHFSSHNNYVDLLAQTGFLGLLAFVWFVVEIALIAMRFYSQVSDSFAKAYAIGVLGGLAGSLVSGMLADWIIPFVYNIGLRGFRSSFLFWFFLGGMLALKRITTTKIPERIEANPGTVRNNPIIVGRQAWVPGGSTAVNTRQSPSEY